MGNNEPNDAAKRDDYDIVKDGDENVLSRVVKCMTRNQKSLSSSGWRLYTGNDDDLEHYNAILAATERHRLDVRPHHYANYSGPWVENHFITTFAKQELKSFGGLVPLFIPWTDVHSGLMHKRNDGVISGNASRKLWHSFLVQIAKMLHEDLL